MIRFAVLALSLAALAGCASSTKNHDRDWQRYDSDRTPSSMPTHQCVAKVGPNCNAKILWHCPQGFVDGCHTPGSTGKHECVTRDSDTACNLRVEMMCPEGFADGCENGSSRNHECLPRASATPCSAEIMMVCPEGFHDACVGDAGAPPMGND